MMDFTGFTSQYEGGSILFAATFPPTVKAFLISSVKKAAPLYFLLYRSYLLDSVD